MMDDVQDRHGAVEVRIADLVQHKAFQVRKKLDEATVLKYRRGFDLDGPIAYSPILVGRIKPPERTARGRPNQQFRIGALVLLAGFHRVKACTQSGRETILARIVDTTAREAQWVAAESNMAHGLPLKGAELRAAFHAYLRAGKYRSADGKRQSLRDMGRYFGKHHETIRDWMNVTEFRWLRDQYLPEEANKDRPKDVPIPLPDEEQALLTIEEALRQARNIDPMLDPEQRGRLVAAIRETLTAIEGEEQGDVQGLASSAT